MPGGIQRTPFDTVDLGSQLLESLVAAQRTKDEKERMKLQEKQLGLQEKEMQLRAVQTADPLQAGISDILGNLLGAGGPVQPRASVEERQFAGLQDYLEKNPNVKEMHNRLQATGTLLQPDEAVQGAQIAAGLKVNARDRAAMIGDLLQQYGSPAAPAWNRAIGRELGVQAPTGVKTLQERAVGAEETRARETGATAEAARIRARQDAVEFIAGGFQPLPGSPAAADPKLAKQYAEELTDFAMGKSNAVSPDAITQMVPLDKWGAILKASAQPSPQFATRLALYKEMLDYANKQKGKVDKAMLQQIQDLGQSLYDEALPPLPEGSPIPEGESGISSLISGPIGRMIGLATGTAADEITLSGRPLKPELREVLRYGLKAVGKVPGSPLGGLSMLEGSLETLDKVYKSVLPLITTTAPGEVSGLLKQGNIDLYNRLSVSNPQGGVSTVYSTSFNIDGKEVLIPRVSEDGTKILSPQEALEQYKRTGKHLGVFDTVANANKYAQQLHNDYAAGKFGTGRTLGALSSPEAAQIAPEQKQKLQGLVAAYRSAGGTPEEASAIEGELLEIMQSGDAKAQQEYMQALLDDIRSMKATGRLEPRE